MITGLAKLLSMYSALNSRRLDTCAIWDFIHSFILSFIHIWRVGCNPSKHWCKYPHGCVLGKLVGRNQNKISNMIYSILYKLHDLEIFKSDWISTVRSILNASGIWLSQTIPFSVECLRHNLKIGFIDQFIQKWHEGISQIQICTNHKTFKNIIGFEKYLIELREELRKYLTKFRCRNHWLPIKTRCHENVLRDMRIYMSTLSQRHWRWIPLFIMLSPI